MRALLVIFLMMSVVFVTWGAKVSENCMKGLSSPAKCCKRIPNGDSTHLADSKDCTSFYVCRNNKPVKIPCSDGQIWDVEAQKCQDAESTDQCPQKKS